MNAVVEQTVASTTPAELVTTDPGVVPEIASLRSGHLWKRSGLLNLWKKRYFLIKDETMSLDQFDLMLKKHNKSGHDTLELMAKASLYKGAFLVYFESETALDRPLGLIPLDTVKTAVTVQIYGRPFTFKLETDGRTYTFSASSHSEVQGWLNTFDTLEVPDMSNAHEMEEFKAAMHHLRSLVVSKPLKLKKITKKVEHDKVVEEVVEDESNVKDVKPVEDMVIDVPVLGGTKEEMTPVVVFPEPQPVKSFARKLAQKFRAKSDKKKAVPVADVEAPAVVEEPVVVAEEEVAPVVVAVEVPTIVVEDMDAAAMEPIVLDGFPVPENALLSGWVEKQSMFLKNWNRRFFVLTAGADNAAAEEKTARLSYFRPQSARDGPHAGWMTVNAGTVVERVNVDGGKLAFSVVTKRTAVDMDAASCLPNTAAGTPVQSYLLATNTEEERTQWIEAIETLVASWSA